MARLIALGHTNAELAQLLGISTKTIETHRQRIMTKLRLGSRADLVRFAMAQGLLTTGPGGNFFQCCAGCKVLWSLRSQFLSDREVRFLRYEPAKAVNAPGLMVFNHDRCGTKLALPLESFRELAGGSVTGDSCAAKGRNEEYCLVDGEQTPCPLMCVCAFVWRITQLIKRWPKNGGAG